MADRGHPRASIEEGVGDSTFAACGLPPDGLTGVWGANDSELLCSASAQDVEHAIRAAQEELVREGEEHRRAAKSKQRRAEIADRCGAADYAHGLGLVLVRASYVHTCLSQMARSPARFAARSTHVCMHVCSSVDCRACA